MTDKHSARDEFYNMPQLLDFIGCLKFHYEVDKIILETLAGSTGLLTCPASYVQETL